MEHTGLMARVSAMGRTQGLDALSTHAKMLAITAATAAVMSASVLLDGQAKHVRCRVSPNTPNEPHSSHSECKEEQIERYHSAPLLIV